MAKRFTVKVPLEQPSVEILSTGIDIIDAQQLTKSRHFFQLSIMGKSVNADWNV